MRLRYLTHRRRRAQSCRRKALFLVAVSLLCISFRCVGLRKEPISRLHRLRNTDQARGKQARGGTKLSVLDVDMQERFKYVILHAKRLGNKAES
jgi:hypothetical protein